MITLASIFRDSTSYLDRYFTQVEALRAKVPLRLVLAEGDSEDATDRNLRQMIGSDDLVVNVNHGGHNYGSTDHPIRWANIAKVVRGLLDHVDDPGEAFIYVESDLIWNERNMLRLLEADRCVAPMVFASDDRDRFYDTWGFRQNGGKFFAHYPYFPVDRPSERYVKIDSCGNCFVVPYPDFEVVQEWDGMWPFRAGGRLWADTEVHVRHP